MAQFTFKDPGEGIHEAEIQEILVDEGDTVREGQEALVIETDKAALEIPSPHSGTVGTIKVSVGDTVRVGDVLMEIDTADAAEATEQEEPAEAEEEEPEEEEPEEEEPEEEEPEEEDSGDDDSGDEEPEKDDRREQPERDSDDPKKRSENKQKQKHSETDSRDGGRGVKAAPATRRLASELEVDLDLDKVTPTGPDDRVTAEDVRAVAWHQAPPRLPDMSKWGETRREPLRSIRKATARQMALSSREVARVTHHDVADVTELERARRRMAPEVEDRGGKLTLTVLAMKAAVAALKRWPRFNASIDWPNRELEYHDFFHIGMAVQTERGLMVPVVRDVDSRTVAELSRDMLALADKARDGKLKRADMQGATFTISNVGPLGGTAFTPVVNWPQCAILGLSTARLEPVAEGDIDDARIVARLRVTLSLSYDHRIVDGAEAARFTSAIREALSDPESLLLGV